MRQRRGAEQREVGGVRDDARVEQRVVGQSAARAEPGVLVGIAHRRRLGRAGTPRVADVTESSASTTCGAPCRSIGLELVAPGAGRDRRDVSATGTVGHAVVVLGPASSTWNDAARLKMAWPCWMATTRRVVKLPTVADAVDLVHDRDLGVAELEEVRVHRVHPPLGVDRATGRHQAPAPAPRRRRAAPGRGRG